MDRRIGKLNRPTLAGVAATGIALALLVSAIRTNGHTDSARAHAMDAPVPKLARSAPPIIGRDAQGKPINIHGNRPLVTVLEFGRMGDPLFRRHLPAAENMAKRLRRRVRFLVMLGGRRAETAKNRSATRILQRDRRRLKVRYETLLLDGRQNRTLTAYGGLPNGTFIINKDGKIVARYPWMDPPRVSGALAAVLRHRRPPPRFQGPPQLLKPLRIAVSPADYFGINPRTVGGTVDSLHLRERQQLALVPPLSKFMAALKPAQAAYRKFKKNHSPADRRRFRATRRKVVLAARRLEHVMRELLNDQQYKKMLAVLARGPLRGVFLRGT